jgi:hypothetical protein
MQGSFAERVTRYIRERRGRGTMSVKDSNSFFSPSEAWLEESDKTNRATQNGK